MYKTSKAVARDIQTKEMREKTERGTLRDSKYLFFLSPFSLSHINGLQVNLLLLTAKRVLPSRRRLQKHLHTIAPTRRSDYVSISVQRPFFLRLHTTRHNEFLNGKRMHTRKHRQRYKLRYVTWFNINYCRLRSHVLRIRLVHLVFMSRKLSRDAFRVISTYTTLAAVKASETTLQMIY